MKDDEQKQIIDRALSELETGPLRRFTASNVIEQVLRQARTTGKLETDELERGVKGLVSETGTDKLLRSTGRDGRNDGSGDADSPDLFGVLMLLILLLLLLSLLPNDSDTAALFDDLIQQLLDLLKGGGS